jgi:hypothetical protein
MVQYFADGCKEGTPGVSRKDSRMTQGEYTTIVMPCTAKFNPKG